MFLSYDRTSQPNNQSEEGEKTLNSKILEYNHPKGIGNQAPGPWFVKQILSFDFQVPAEKGKVVDLGVSAKMPAPLPWQWQPPTILILCLIATAAVEASGLTGSCIKVI